MNNLYQLVEQRKRKIIKQAVARLPIRESWAIRMRFWGEGMMIEDIARTFKMTWSDTDQLIEDALAHLKEMVLGAIPNLSTQDIALIYQAVDGGPKTPLTHSRRSKTVLKALRTSIPRKKQARVFSVGKAQIHEGAPL